jgi:hypothetical protein
MGLVEYDRDLLALNFGDLQDIMDVLQVAIVPQTIAGHGGYPRILAHTRVPTAKSDIRDELSSRKGNGDSMAS